MIKNHHNLDIRIIINLYENCIYCDIETNNNSFLVVGCATPLTNDSKSSLFIISHSNHSTPRQLIKYLRSTSYNPIISSYTSSSHQNPNSSL